MGQSEDRESQLVSESLRRRQAAQTRETIVSASLALFAEQGYARTTVEQIARRARVSVSSVYAIFGSKRQVLVEIRRSWFREADLSPLVERALAEPDGRARLLIAAEWIRNQLEVGASISLVVDEAIRTDDRVAETWGALRLVADDKITAVVEGIRDQLRPGVSVTDAVDVVWALSRAAVFRELIDDRGWTLTRYQDWLGKTLCHQLLGTDVNPASSDVEQPERRKSKRKEGR